MRRLTSLIATIVAVMAAAPASARTIDLGVGQTPTVAVDPAGTAHIVFLTPGGYTYCRLPRNAPACDIRTALPVDRRAGYAQIFRRPADGALLIVQGSQGATEPVEQGVVSLRFSLDGGVTWQGPQPIATGTSAFNWATLALDGQSVALVQAGDSTGFIFERGPFAGQETRRLDLVARPDGSTFGVNGGSIATLPDGRMIAVADTGSGTRWRLFGGGEAYDQNAWQPFPARLLRGESGPVVVTGPRGTYLLDHRSLADQRLDDKAPFGLRSLDARRLRWRATKTAGADRTGFGPSILFEDGRGRLHLAWRTVSGSSAASCIVYARTGPRRSSWFGRSTTIARASTTAREAQTVDLGAGADGRGVAVWSDQGDSPGTEHAWVATLRQSAGRYRPIRNPFDRAECPRR